MYKIIAPWNAAEIEHSKVLTSRGHVVLWQDLHETRTCVLLAEAINGLQREREAAVSSYFANSPSYRQGKLSKISSEVFHLSLLSKPCWIKQDQTVTVHFF